MFEILVRNGTVLDGSGSRGFRADVAVGEGKIQEEPGAALGAGLVPGGTRLVVKLKKVI